MGTGAGKKMRGKEGWGGGIEERERGGRAPWYRDWREGGAARVGVGANVVAQGGGKHIGWRLLRASLGGGAGGAAPRRVFRVCEAGRPGVALWREAGEPGRQRGRPVARRHARRA
jgi:hypothetical protein